MMAAAFMRFRGVIGIDGEMMLSKYVCMSTQHICTYLCCVVFAILKYTQYTERRRQHQESSLIQVKRLSH